MEKIKPIFIMTEQPLENGLSQIATLFLQGREDTIIEGMCNLAKENESFRIILEAVNRRLHSSSAESISSKRKVYPS